VSISFLTKLSNPSSTPQNRYGPSHAWSDEAARHDPLPPTSTQQAEEEDESPGEAAKVDGLVPRLTRGEEEGEVWPPPISTSLQNQEGLRRRMDMECVLAYRAVVAAHFLGPHNRYVLSYLGIVWIKIIVY
jgi:hypothetical protein